LTLGRNLERVSDIFRLQWRSVSLTGSLVRSLSQLVYQSGRCGHHTSILVEDFLISGSIKGDLMCSIKLSHMLDNGRLMIINAAQFVKVRLHSGRVLISRIIAIMIVVIVV
jgi:hypothetical protein